MLLYIYYEFSELVSRILLLKNKITREGLELKRDNVLEIEIRMVG